MAADMSVHWCLLRTIIHRNSSNQHRQSILHCIFSALGLIPLSDSTYRLIAHRHREVRTENL